MSNDPVCISFWRGFLISIILAVTTGIVVGLYFASWAIGVVSYLLVLLVCVSITVYRLCPLVGEATGYY